MLSAFPPFTSKELHVRPGSQYIRIPAHPFEENSRRVVDDPAVGFESRHQGPFGIPAEQQGEGVQFVVELALDGVPRLGARRITSRGTSWCSPVSSGATLQDYYVVERDGKDVEGVPVTDLTDAEIHQKVGYYRAMGTAYHEHAHELIRCKEWRNAGSPAEVAS